MLTLRLAWRNLWRNRRRTWITVAAVLLNTAVLIATFSFMEGTLAQFEHNATNLFTGEAQVHAVGYLADRSFYKTVDQPEALIAAARARGVAVAPRAYGFGLLSSGSKSAGASFWGVDPAAERAAFDLPRELAAGEYLKDEPPGDGPRPVILGRKLARSLDAHLGSELVAVVQGADGSLGNELFVVQGVLKSIGEVADRSTCILARRDFEELFVAPGVVHEVAFNTRRRSSPEALTATLAPLVGEQDLRTWRQLLPAVSDMLEVSAAGMWLFALIFFLAAGLGVLNTLLMATYERTREFGILKAIGASPWRIVRDVAAEAFVLGLVACTLGGLLGAAMAGYLQVAGLDMRALVGDTSLSLSGVVFDPVYRGLLSVKVVLQPIVAMWTVCVVASLYPALRAARLDPIRAIHKV